jgi:hypothetical protein
MEAVQILECSREGLPGVEGAERSDGGGGNWGGPPRPKRAPVPADQRCPITGVEPGSGRGAGRESEAAVVPLDPQDNTTCGEGRAAASFTRKLKGPDR